MTTIAVLGGGLSGLALGYFLRSSDVTILEREATSGGLCRSFCDEGFTFDLGSHVIFSRNTETLDLILGLLGENKVQKRRNAKIFFHGSYVKYPFENGLADLPLQDNYECLYHYIESKVKNCKQPAREPSNFEEWIFQAFGSGIAEKYLKPYNAKIWKHDLKDIAVDWVGGRVPQPPIEDVIKSSLGIPTEGYLHQLDFYYPHHGGINALVTSLEQRLTAKIITNFGITSIRKENDGTWLISNGSNTLQFNRIVSTIPLHELVKALDDVPADVVDAINGLYFNSLIVVGLGLHNSGLDGLSWLYFPSNEETVFHRLSFPSNFSRNMVPDRKSSILAEISCKTNDALWGADDDTLIESVVTDLHRLKIIDRNDVCYSKVRRIKYAYVIYDLNYQKKMSLIRAYFKKIGIYLCGRFSEFKYLNMGACIESARDVACELNS